jgi:hypothetical protein
VPQRWICRIAPLDTDHQARPVFGAEKERTRSPDGIRLPPIGDTCLARRAENGPQIRFPLERGHLDRFADFISRDEPCGVCGWSERIKGGAATSIHAADGSARTGVLSNCPADGLYGAARRVRSRMLFAGQSLSRFTLSRKKLFLRAAFRSRGWSFGPTHAFYAGRRRE